MRLILSWDGQHIVAAEVASGRPLAARILVGQPVERVVELLPRLFSLCGQAQGVAARLACRAALGHVPTHGDLLDEGRRVALEAIGEHLWRLLLDWPPMLGLPVRKAEFLDWRKRLLTVSDPLAAADFGNALSRWLDAEKTMCSDMCNRLCQMPGTQPSSGLLPMLTASAWAQVAIDEAFATAPIWAGQPAETGSFARRFADPDVAQFQSNGAGIANIAARLAARYADLRFLAEALAAPQHLDGWLDAVPLAKNIGLARVETARGLLLHLLEIKDDKVGRYVIVAPTEWNFHAQGAFVRAIVGLPAASREQAGAVARRLALALDPCVAYEVIINDA